MSVHQIIYTSCKRGIQGIHDGQQVFSQDKDFGTTEEVQGFFSYQQPALPPGTAMSEEIALTLPRSFSGKILGSGAYALGLSSYLGRDYMGSTGRFGNFLSHVVVAQRDDIRFYPCEFFASDMLRSSMDFGEVNSPDTPAFLPSPVLEKGAVVSENSVMEFLKEEGRMAVFLDMVYALLSFSSERKRLVICDEPEHIIQWIAALHYALPLDWVMKIPFSTYVYDPSLSDYQLCGVEAQGTRFTAETESQHFTFHLLEHRCPSFAKDPDFYEFLETAYSYAFHCIGDFHDFLQMGYRYNQANHELYQGYALFTLLSEGVAGMSLERLRAALAFGEQYGRTAEKTRIAKVLLEQNHILLTADVPVFLLVLEVLLQERKNLSPEEGELLKQLIVHKILQDFISPHCQVEKFQQFYKDVSSACDTHHLSVATELMEDKNRVSLLSLMSQNVEPWKITFFIKIISSYVKDQKLPVTKLFPEEPLGQLYYGILRNLYLEDKSFGAQVVTCILKEFSTDSQYLVEMSFHLEAVLLDLKDKQTQQLWDTFCQLMLTHQKSKLPVAYQAMKEYQRYSVMKQLYILEMGSCATVKQCSTSFFRYYQDVLPSKSKEFLSMAEEAVLLYFGRLNDMGKDALVAKQELLRFLLKEHISMKHGARLVDDALGELELSRLSPAEEALVEDAVDYLCNFQKKQPTELLLLLYLGGRLTSLASKAKAEKALSELEEQCQGITTELKSKERITAYLDWVTPSISHHFRKKEQMLRCFQLVKLTSSTEKYALELLGQVYLKQSKEEKDFQVLAEYFAFVSALEREELFQVLEQIWKKQSKSRQGDWEKAVEASFSRDKTVMEDLDGIKSRNEGGGFLSNFWKKK